jgi:hypothetical protein
VSIESLDLGEEGNLEGILVEKPHRVVGVGGSDQPAPHVADGVEMPGRHVATHTENGEIASIAGHRRGS